MRHIVVYRPRELADVHVAAWRRLCESDARLSNPFLHPAFTFAVAAVRNDVEVAVLEESGLPVGFFPFQRSAWNIGNPVGGRLSGYQAFVVADGIKWSATELIEGCKLSSWQFEQLVAAQEPFREFHRQYEGSPYLDLSNGYEAYREARRASGSKRILKIESLRRKLEREAGPVRFEFHNPNPALLTTLREWKSNQYRRTGLTDSFSFEWTVALFEHILQNPSDRFSAVVSVVWALERPVAISYALRAGGVLHGCFTGFDEDFSKYSPGSMMLLEIAREAPVNGIRHFELGNGVEYYKHSLASGETMMAQGSVDCGQIVRLMRRGWHSAGRWARSNRFSPLTTAPLKVIRPLREWLSFR